MSNLTVASIFSGIGGFEAGFAKAGLATVLMCEKEPAAQAVLRERFADIELADDVTTMTTLPRCDILVGGWPCQDLSQAGRMPSWSCSVLTDARAGRTTHPKI